MLNTIILYIEIGAIFFNILEYIWVYSIRCKHLVLADYFILSELLLLQANKHVESSICDRAMPFALKPNTFMPNSNR